MRELMFAGLLMVTGCDGGPASIGELKQPTLQLARSVGACTDNVVVDGEDVVWAERECEMSIGAWRRVASTDAGQRSSLEMLFDAARPTMAATCDRANPRTTLYDAYRGVGGRDGGWSACTDESRSLTAAEQAFVDAMMALAAQ